MSNKNVQNLLLLGVGAIAVYWLFLRKPSSQAALVQLPGPPATFPSSIAVTPQIIGTGSMYPFPSSVEITPRVQQPAPTPEQTFTQTYGFDPSLLYD